MEPPDALEKRIRFGCGFVFGLVVGGYIALRLFPWNGFVVVAIILVSALVCGVLAMKQGDRFWLALTSLRWWW
jgi:hypothetical protein